MNAAISAPRHALIVIALIVLTLIGSLPGLSSMQAIDRDEARYAQASVQMRDSGDYVNIRFHDRERHKKPAGIYWLQTLSLKAFSTPQSRSYLFLKAILPKQMPPFAPHLSGFLAAFYASDN